METLDYDGGTSLAPRASGEYRYRQHYDSLSHLLTQNDKDHRAHGRMTGIGQGTWMAIGTLARRV
ncbi:MAG: hypothetical protein M5U15_15445 [Kiritimatiellae bacterium]|nr:hypothetical protein [Kiritimatiellia bacterium]